MTVRWADERGLQILKEKVDSVRYPVGDEESYIDDSQEILKSILNDVQLIESDSDSEQSEQSDYDSEQSNEQSDCDSALSEESVVIVNSVKRSTDVFSLR